MTIDVIIPNYNGSALIRENLPKVLLAVTRYNAGIIIVDDFSKLDDFAEASKFVDDLKEKGEKVILLRNEKNFGFATTVNRGVAESKADFVVLLNTDVVPEKDFLVSLISDMIENPNLFGVGIMDKSVEDSNVVLRGRGLGFWKNGFIAHDRGEVNNQSTFWISGGSSIIRREYFNKLGGFDPLYNPFYWEDIDLSYRARKSGYDVIFENRSAVVHKHSEGAIKNYFDNNKIQTISYRNQITFVWKNITDIKLLLSNFLWLPYHIISAICKFNLPFILGFVYALLNLPAIIRKRLAQKKFYKKRDQELFIKI